MKHILQSTQKLLIPRLLFFITTFICLFFTVSESSGQNVKKPTRYEFISPTTGEKLEIAQKDVNIGTMTNFLEQAISICNNLGRGWRIPTYDEIEFLRMEYYQKGIGDFSDKYYVYFDYDGTHYYCLYFKDGKKSSYSDDRRLRVVRAIN
jgi:hypothetical protein